MLQKDLETLEKNVSQAAQLLAKCLNTIKEQRQSLVREESEGYSPQMQIGHCLFCKKPILKSDETTRSMHTSCYNWIYQDQVSTGKKTLKQLEAEGLIGPTNKPGRKKKHDIESIISSSQQRITDGNKKK